MRIGKYYISLRKPGALIFPLIVIVFCIMYLIQSSRIYSNMTMILVRITFYAIVVFFSFVLKEEIQINSEKKTDSQESSNKLITNKGKRIWFFIIGMGTYIIMIDKIGFTFSTMLFTAIMMSALGIKDKKILTIVPICLVIIIYFMFNKWLMIPLPPGIFGF